MQVTAGRRGRCAPPQKDAAVNPTNLTLVIRGLGLMLLIVGGIYALYAGFRIIQRERTGSARATFKILGASFTANGIGAVVMMTAGVWAYLGVRMAPNLAMDPTGNTRVYAFVTEKGRATVPELAAVKSGPSTATLENLDRDGVLRTFKQSVVATQEGPWLATVQGSPARLDLRAATAEKTADGKWQVLAPLLTGFHPQKYGALITFEPESKGGKTAFVPQKADISMATNLAAPTG